MGKITSLLLSLKSRVLDGEKVRKLFQSNLTPLVTAGVGDYVGTLNPIFIESQGNGLIGNLGNHSSILLTGIAA